MRISDWSSDVCSSDLIAGGADSGVEGAGHGSGADRLHAHAGIAGGAAAGARGRIAGAEERRSGADRGTRCRARSAAIGAGAASARIDVTIDAGGGGIPHGATGAVADATDGAAQGAAQCSTERTAPSAAQAAATQKLGGRGGRDQRARGACGCELESHGMSPLPCEAFWVLSPAHETALRFNPGDADIFFRDRKTTRLNS